MSLRSCICEWLFEVVLPSSLYLTNVELCCSYRHLVVVEDLAAVDADGTVVGVRVVSVSALVDIDAVNLRFASGPMLGNHPLRCLRRIGRRH